MPAILLFENHVITFLFNENNLRGEKHPLACWVGMRKDVTPRIAQPTFGSRTERPGNLFLFTLFEPWIKLCLNLCHPWLFSYANQKHLPLVSNAWSWVSSYKIESQETRELLTEGGLQVIETKMWNWLQRESRMEGSNECPGLRHWQSSPGSNRHLLNLGAQTMYLLVCSWGLGR